MTTEYQPIECDRHSEMELLAMRRARVDARVVGLAGTIRVTVSDIVVRDRAEFLVVELSAGERCCWRLDQVVALIPVALDSGTRPNPVTSKKLK